MFIRPTQKFHPATIYTGKVAVWMITLARRDYYS
jgi:hypothetical protein